MKNDRTIRLADGRTLGYALLGDPDGKPLIFFHGTPGSRLMFSEDDAIAQVPGLRLVLPERPGYGLSDPKPDRVLLDWADDVAELADHLGLDRFAVGGLSGGGPHALACAHALGGRVDRALVLASPAADFPGATRGLSFGNRVGIWLDRFFPGLLRWLQAQQRSAFEKDPAGYAEAVARGMAAPDQQILADPALRDALVRDLREAYRQGSEAAFLDGRLAMTGRSWGFDLREIRVPVDLWHGEEDRLVTRGMAECLAREIPDATLHLVQNAGHLLSDHDEVVSEMRRILGL